jgi:ABC-type uncharacterized transport system substrate-binding protein
MMPPPSQTLLSLRQLQPGLKRLAVLWTSPTNEFYINDLRKSGKELNVEIQGEKIKDISGLPDRLRQLQGQTDALWIPSDPLMVGEANLVLIAQFAESAHVPFYSSIKGLTDKGAAATISVRYKDIGLTAAQVGLNILAGKTSAPNIYVQSIEVIQNKQAEGTSSGSKEVSP